MLKVPHYWKAAKCYSFVTNLPLVFKIRRVP